MQRHGLVGNDTVKVRVGLGLGVRTDLHDGRYAHLVDELERLRFDSLWLSERIATSAPDPLAAIGFGLGRTTELKFGTSVLILPGRNPVVLAKHLATLATLAPGRLLPAFGMGAAEPREHAAFGVDPSERAGRMMEALEVMRLAWTGEPFDFDGDFYHYHDVRVRPVPDRLDVWLGGDAPSTLRRVGQVADGWLPSFITPDAAADGRAAIEQAATEAGRSIEADHFGVLLPYTLTSVPEAMSELLARRRPGVPVTDVVPVGWGALAGLMQRFVDAGISKFVVLPLDEPSTPQRWTAHLEELAATVHPLEN